MTSRDVLNIHDSNACLGVSDIHTRLEISIRCAAHELSYSILMRRANSECTCIDKVSRCISLGNLNKSIMFAVAR